MDPLTTPTSAARPRRGRALLGLIGCCSLWGLSFPVIKALGLHLSARAPGINTWFAAAATVVVRFGFGAAFLAAWGLPRPTRSEVAQGLSIGVFSAIGMLLQMDALNFSSASTSAFLTQGYILILPLVAAIAARALPPLKTMVCVLLSAVGLAVLSGFDWSGVHLGRGESETLLAACAFAVQISSLDARRYRGNRARVVTVLMFAAVALLLTPVALGTMRGVADLGLLFATPVALGFVFVLTVPCTIMAFSLMNRYQPEVSASEAGIIYGVEPLFASLCALFLPGIFASFSGIEYPNEVLTVRLLLGGGLLVCANVLLQVRWSPLRRPSAS
jgi:drug/metabolite transporter (DMT)-like permease